MSGVGEGMGGGDGMKHVGNHCFRGTHNNEINSTKLWSNTHIE